VSLYRDTAVVLRRHKLGEADRILTLLTRHHGIVRAVAKGIRRTSSRFGARLEPGMHVDVQLATGRNLHVVTQVVTLDAFAEAFTRDYADYTSATVALETAERMCSEEGEPATQQYLLLVGALRSFAGHTHDRSLILDAYLLRALAIGGYAPSFDSCSRCHTPGPHAAFNPSAGGMVCAVCRPASVAMPARGTVRLLAALLSGGWDIADASTPGERAEADRLVSSYLRWHLERQLKSLPLLDTWRDPALAPLRNGEQGLEATGPADLEADFMGSQPWDLETPADPARA
jgi:DNA repair protein RecO (recombination protein O)